MKRRLFLRQLAVGIALFTAACAHRPKPDDLVSVSYEGADALVERSRLAQDEVVVYGVFTPVGQVERSSPFGRIVAETMASRLVQRGRQVAEVRLGHEITLRQGGPYTLSTDIRKVANTVRARVALTGSYAATLDYVLINARLIDVASGVVLASWDRRVQLSPSDNALLTDYHYVNGYYSWD